MASPKKKTKKSSAKSRRPGDVHGLGPDEPVEAPEDHQPNMEHVEQWPGLLAPGVGLSGWDYWAVKGALREALAGQYSRAGLLMDDMLADPTIAHCAQVRRDVFTTVPEIFTPGPGPNGERCRDFLREIWPDIMPLATKHDFWDHLRFAGEGCGGMDWEVRTDGRDRWLLPRIKPWHPSQTYRTYLPDLSTAPGATADGRVLIAITKQHGPVVVEPGLGRWIHFSDGTLNPAKNALVRILGEIFLGSTYTRHDVLALQERFGQGFIKFHHPVKWNDRQVAQSVKSIRSGGRGTVISVQRTADGKQLTDVELMKADASGNQLFDLTHKMLRTQVLLAMLGQDGTSVQGSGPYTQMTALKEVLWHKRELDAAAFGDARLTVQIDNHGIPQKRWIPHNGVIRSQITRWIAYFNFGQFEDAPYIWLDATPPDERLNREKMAIESSQKRGRAIAMLGRGLKELYEFAAHEKIDIDLEWLCEQVGVSLVRPPDDEDTAHHSPLLPWQRNKEEPPPLPWQEYEKRWTQ